MKKSVANSLILFFLSIICQSVYRAFPSDEMIRPFMLKPDIEISVAWYAKHLSDLFSFMLLMFCIVSILRPVEKHLQDSRWVGHNAMLTFVKLWHRIFFVVAITGALDIVHYFISFKQTQWFFLAQNGVFFLMTFFYLFKAYRK